MLDNNVSFQLQMCDAKNKKNPIKSIRVIVYESDQDSTHIKVYAHKGDTCVLSL